MSAADLGPPISPARRSLRRAQLGLFLLVDASWLFGWSVALGAWIGPGAGLPLLGPLALGALLLVASGVTRLALASPAFTKRARLALPALGLLAALVVGTLEILTVEGDRNWSELWQAWYTGAFGFRLLGVLGLTILAWWRGIVAGRSRLSADEVESSARSALTALVGVLVIMVLGAGGVPVGPLLAAAAALIVGGLVGVPLARVLDVGASALRQEQPTLAVNRHWLTMLLGTVGVILLATATVALVLTFDRLDQVLAPLGNLLGTVLWALVYVIAVPIGFLVEGLIYLFQLLLRPGNRPPLTVPNLAGLQQFRNQAQSTVPVAPLVILALKVLLVLLVVAVVAWLLGRSVFRSRDWVSEDGVEEARDFVWSWSALRAAFLAWLRRLFRRASAPVIRWAPAGGQRPVAAGRATDPRGMYRELLRLGAHLGRRRARSETPLEYERALGHLAPLSAAPADVDAVTAVYSQARYGETSPDQAATAQARAALDRLEGLSKT
jgi:hypothetical protein